MQLISLSELSTINWPNYMRVYHCDMI